MLQFDHDLFADQVSTEFKVKLADAEMPLRLVEVTRYLPQQHEQAGLERFSLFFEGPPNAMLPQALYPMTHEKLGDVEIFIVPIAGDNKKIRYEAIFNYYQNTKA